MSTPILQFGTSRFLLAHVALFVSEALERTEWLELLREMVESGEIRLQVAGEYAPEQTAEAQRTLAAGGVRGRPVIVF